MIGSENRGWQNFCVNDCQKLLTISRTIQLQAQTCFLPLHTFTATDQSPFTLCLFSKGRSWDNEIHSSFLQWIPGFHKGQTSIQDVENTGQCWVCVCVCASCVIVLVLCMKRAQSKKKKENKQRFLWVEINDVVIMHMREREMSV